MANQLTNYLKRNQKIIIIFGIVGALFYFLSKQIFPQDASVLQSSLGESIVDTIGITGDIKTMLLFIAIGIIAGLLIGGKK